MKLCSDRLIWQTCSIQQLSTSSRSQGLAEAKTDPEFIEILLIKALSKWIFHLPKCPLKTHNSTIETSWRAIRVNWTRACHSPSYNLQHETPKISHKDPWGIKGLKAAHETSYRICRWQRYKRRLPLRGRLLNHQVQVVNSCTRITHTSMALRCPLVWALLKSNGWSTRILPCASLTGMSLWLAPSHRHSARRSFKIELRSSECPSPQ